MQAVPRRRHVLQVGVSLGLAALAPTLRAHEYYTTRFIVEHPWTHASSKGATTAAIGMSFLEVTLADRLIGAQSPVAAAAELVGSDGAVASGIDIPARQKLTLTAQGAHLRLLGLKQPLALGREYPVTLLFDQVGALKASFLVDYPAPET
jgi:copper(I)-binding protein